MTLEHLYCPLCAGELDGVDTGRFQREHKPGIFRCAGCGKGWEVMAIGSNLMVSQAPSYDAPVLKVHNDH